MAQIKMAQVPKCSMDTQFTHPYTSTLLITIKMFWYGCQAHVLVQCADSTSSCLHEIFLSYSLSPHADFLGNFRFVAISMHVQAVLSKMCVHVHALELS